MMYLNIEFKFVRRRYYCPLLIDVGGVEAIFVKGKVTCAFVNINIDFIEYIVFNKNQWY